MKIVPRSLKFFGIIRELTLIHTLSLLPKVFLFKLVWPCVHVLEGLSHWSTP